MSDAQTDGRKANGAQPLGRPYDETSDDKVKRVGRAEQDSAGPDGPDPTETAALVRPPD